MLIGILSCACNFSCHDTILIITVTTNMDVWELIFVRATERSNWPGERRCSCPQRTQARSSAKWGYTDSEREYRTSEGLHCLHFLFLYNCLSDMLSIWSWFAFLFFICHAKVPVPPRNQQHLILLPSLSQYELFAFPQALVTFWKDRQATKALLASWSCALLCCVKLCGFFF